MAELEEGIMDDLRWLGIDWDEGPVRQSERRERHLEAAGGATAPVRDGACWLGPSGVPEFVIVRSDGRPTYNWATAVDDLDLGITQVIRGADHISNTPLQQAAIRSLGGEPPEYLHHAVVPGEAGKLSKREAASSIAALREAGYPAEAVVNLLGLVGELRPRRRDAHGRAGRPLRPERMARGDVSSSSRGCARCRRGHLRRLPDRGAGRLACCRCRAGQPIAAGAGALAPALRGVHTLAEAADLVACVLVTPEPALAARDGRDPGRFPEQLYEPEARGAGRRAAPRAASRCGRRGWR